MLSSTSRRARPLLALAAVALTGVGLAPPAIAADPVVAAVETRRIPPPALFVTGQQRAEPLAITRLDVSVRIVGHLAETRTTLVFSNPNNRRVAGDLYFPLPAGATVSGYALDVDGELVDGVVVAKQEARRIYEAETRKGVDPGLVEWTQGNVFKTRVFPIPANGSRTIAVRWVSELDVDDDGAARFVLPLGYDKPIATSHIRIEVVKAGAAPLITDGPAGLQFTGGRDAYLADATANGKALPKPLTVRIPDATKEPVQVERALAGEVHFALRDAPALPAGKNAIAARAVRLVWDASLSRDGGDHAREISVLGSYLKGLPAGANVDLRMLRNELGPGRSFALPQELPQLLATLGDVAYDGGTRMSALGAAFGPGADVIIVVTDGLHTFGSAAFEAAAAPVFVLTASARQNRALMAAMANPTGGAVFDLGRQTDADVLARLGRPAFAYLGARVVRGLVDGLHPAGPAPLTGPLLLSGRLGSDEAEIELRYGTAGKVTATRTLVIRAAGASRGDLVQRAWAQAALNDMLAAPVPDELAITELGQKYGLVTPGTSLLVLESLDQYVSYNVRPPESQPKLRAAYDERRSAQQKEAVAARSSRLDEVFGAWQEEVKWWATPHDVPPDFRYRDATTSKSDAPEDRAVGGAAPPMAESAVARPDAMSDSAEESRPEPSKKAKAKEDDGDAGPEAAIALKAWDPDTPYLRALKAASAADRFKVYLEQRKAFGGSPAFFLDCADFFLKSKEEAVGIEVLSNLAELQLEEPALMRVLAHRLTQLERFDDAILVFRAVKELRPDEPQSWRDLALVLARSAKKGDAKARLGEAMTLMAEVVARRWDRFDGIELITLWELNRTWPEARAAGVAQFPLEARFEKKLDVDVRIVMNWDADMTDMDLHVLEPSGEEAYYGHNRTTIGGAVSRDFTQGYGPEVYNVRKAQHGTYKVKTKFYGSSAAQLIGAVTLQVDVYTNYGRSNEQRKSMTLRLTEAKEDFVVGEIEL